MSKFEDKINEKDARNKLIKPVNQTKGDNDNMDNENVEEVENNNEEVEQTEDQTNEEGSTDTEKSDGLVTITAEEYEQMKRDKFNSKIEEKKKRKTVEDTHKRQTWLVKKDLLKRLNKLAGNTRGYKTEFINDAIEHWLEIQEKK